MARFPDINVTGSASAERIVDVVALSWGLTTIGTGSASFVNSDSEEAHKILQQVAEKVAHPSDTVSDLWMKSALHACGLVTAQASSKQHQLFSYLGGTRATVACQSCFRSELCTCAEVVIYDTCYRDYDCNDINVIYKYMP